MLDLGDIKAYLAEIERSHLRPHPYMAALVAEVEQLRQALANEAVYSAAATERRVAKAWELVGQCDMALELIIGSGSLRQIRALAKKMRAKIKQQVQ